MTKACLIKVEDIHMSIERRKYGRGFQYFWRSGEKIEGMNRLARIKNLVVPPMWQKVLICEIEEGHIQATGYDNKNRKQYIYHDDWHLERQTEKFSRVLCFAKALPAMRKRCLDSLSSDTWSREKVLSLMVLILDETGLRIGNDYYSKTNSTYGLSTLRRKHVQLKGQELVLDFIGKKGKHRKVEIEDKLLSNMIKQCSDLPGYSLFRYQNSDNSWDDIDSDDVNEFIKKHMGQQYSCKDFRTWVGTRLAYELYPQALEIRRAAPRKKTVNILLKLVSGELGNTPIICRKYYIHPEILKRVELQTLDIDEKAFDLDHPVSDPSYSHSEIKLLKLLSTN